MMAYRVVRSRRRTMALEVLRDGELVVRTPLGVSQPAVERFVREHETWIQGAVARQRARLEAHPDPSPEESKRLRALAKAVLPEKTAHYARIVGAWPEAITITSARTRFGSCSSKNRISFSWRLMQYPEEAIDYVVVHELCHISHHDHSKAFYDCVAKVLPDWKKRKSRLKT